MKISLLAFDFEKERVSVAFFEGDKALEDARSWAEAHREELVKQGKESFRFVGDMEAMLKYGCSLYSLDGVEK